MVFRPLLRQLVEDRLDHRRVELLRRQAIAAAYYLGIEYLGIERRDPLLARLTQGGDDLQIEWIADGARLLGAVEHGEDANRLGQDGEEIGDRERTEEPHPQHAHPLALAGQPVHGLLGGL